MASAFNSLPALHKFRFSMSELRDVQSRGRARGLRSSRQSAHTWTFVFHRDARAAARGGRSFAALAQLERSIDAGMLDGGRPVWWGRKPMAGHLSPARPPFRCGDSWLRRRVRVKGCNGRSDLHRAGDAVAGDGTLQFST